MMKIFGHLGPFICLLALFVVVTPQSSVAGFTDGLVVYLSFGEGKGDAAKDSSKNKHDGQIEKATWADGKFGRALRLKSGSGSFVHVKSNKI